MITARNLGIDTKTAMFIDSIAVMTTDINELTLVLKRNIENIHTGHYVYLGLVCGVNSATRKAETKIKSIVTCRQN